MHTPVAAPSLPVRRSRRRWVAHVWLWPVVLALPTLAGCDQLGIPTPASQTAKKEADSRAIGAACRHAGRAIEDCYTLNRKADKAAVYAGWREMDDHMRENKIEAVAPVIPRQQKPTAQAGAEGDAAVEGQEGAAADSGAPAGEAKVAQAGKAH